MTKIKKGSLAVEYTVRDETTWVVVCKDLGGGELRTLTFDAIHLDSLIDQLTLLKKELERLAHIKAQKEAFGGKQ